MRNRLLITYLLVAIVSLVVMYLTATFFYRLTTIEYFRRNQIEDSQPFQPYFVEFYQSNKGWNDIDQIDIDQLKAEIIPDKHADFNLALVATDGTVLISDNPANYENSVTETTLDFGAPVVVNGDTVAYIFSVHLNDFLLPEVDLEVVRRTQAAGNWAMVVGLSAGFLISVIMSLALLKPINVTIDVVKKISQGDLSMRVSLEPYRDMAGLGQAVNDMAMDLEKTQRVQKLMLMDIAHDLRTPLSVQKATIEAFEDKLYQFDEEGLAILKNQNNQLIHLVEDLRLLTLSDAEIFVVNKQQVELQAFTKEILNNFDSVFTKKNLHSALSPNEEEYLIDIDPHLMQRVFENLLQNAYQHSPQGGEIRIKILRMINRMEIVVADEGPGIPENKLETIFNRYYRVKQAGEGDPEGLGLGLTISRRIVEAHGGKLFARNTPGKGAEFVLELPYSS